MRLKVTLKAIPMEIICNPRFEGAKGACIMDLAYLILNKWYLTTR